MDNIISWCKKMEIENYTISDGKINVEGNVDISSKKMKCIPFPFGIVNGLFDCSTNKLISLKNCPIEVNGSFYCYNNKIRSLEHCPNIVNGSFSCSFNKLKSLKGIKQVNGDIFTDLENDPIYLYHEAKKKMLYG